MIKNEQEVQCYHCEKDLSGKMKSNGFYRDLFYSLVKNKCESPYFSNEKGDEQLHFCSHHCLKKYITSIKVTTGSANTTVMSTTTGGGMIND